MVDILEHQYFLMRTTIRSEQTRQHYRRAVVWLGQMLGRTPTLDDLTDDNLAAFLGWLTSHRKQTAVTANTSFKCLLAFWRWCRDRGLVAKGPTVEKLPAPKRTPRAWTEAELRRLVAAAAASPGTVCGMPAREWWITLLALEWDTGCRSSELLALRWEWIDWQTGWLRVPAEVRKGGRQDAVYGLLPDTLQWLRRHSRTEGLILNWTQDRSRYWQLWNDLLRRAGLPVTRYTKTQCLRRSFGSWLEAGGGSATDALGHSSRSVTMTSYIDPTIATRRHAERLPFRLLPEEDLGGVS